MNYTEKLQKFFEENGFLVHLFEQDGLQCAEIEKWTDGGVDMIIVLDPFTGNAFMEWVKDFDIDGEIDLHRQDGRYRNSFTISESMKDFTDFKVMLENTLNLLKEEIK